MQISVIVPFYKGNKYVEELTHNIENLSDCLKKIEDIEIELIFVNDSPEIKVNVIDSDKIKILVVNNEHNMGIHGSRANGVKHCVGDWIIFLDQDDLLIPENYVSQIKLCKDADVIVGNAYYYFGDKKQKIYENEKVMKYVIDEKIFVGIRNLIPSPGECMLKKVCIPQQWMNNPMRINGADDWMLWLLLFNSNAKFAINPNVVYIHRNSEEGNLSFDIDKMNASNEEMLKKFDSITEYPDEKKKKLERAIRFKYKYDSKTITVKDYALLLDRFIANVTYKLKRKFMEK